MQSRQQGARLEPLPLEALPQRAAPNGFPGAAGPARGQAASPGRGRSNLDAGRGARGRKLAPAFAAAGPQLPAAPSLPALGGMPHPHHQPLPGQHPAATAAATSRAALLAGAGAERLRQTLPQRSYDLQAQVGRCCVLAAQSCTSQPRSRGHVLHFCRACGRAAIWRRIQCC